MVAPADAARPQPFSERPGLASDDEVDAERGQVEERDLGLCQRTAARDAVLGEHVATAERLEPPGRR